ncbi:hypothetical protein B0A58_00420 [Flavobacterium branchiophilum NBRC 15030 = ATCC 35035]|nr:hypothetical protein B0A58_00420 [Flavobacterium branchiophilum NBRC 15030 = ATCC 35035]
MAFWFFYYCEVGSPLQSFTDGTLRSAGVSKKMGFFCFFNRIHKYLYIFKSKKSHLLIEANRLFVLIQYELVNKLCHFVIKRVLEYILLRLIEPQL